MPILRFFAPQGLGVMEEARKGTEKRNPLRNFHEICGIFTPFHDALAVKIWMDLLILAELWGL